MKQEKVCYNDAIAIKCLGGKLEYVANDPDPKAFEKLTQEYNCSECSSVKLCARVYNILIGVAK